MTQTRCCNRRRLGAGIALGAMLALAAPTLAHANDGRPGTPAQRKACTPDVYRLCAGEIPSVAKITSCLRRKKDSLSAACRAVFEQ